jgi:cell division protein FtsW (lipid II flippase)
MEPAGLFKLCEPAFFYLLISFTIIIMVAINNYGTGYNYCVGVQNCPSTNVVGIFIVKILYILVWTWLLNLMCKNGFEPFSWILVIIPILLMFVFMSMYILNQYDIGTLMVMPTIFN